MNPRINPKINLLKIQIELLNKENQLKTNKIYKLKTNPHKLGVSINSVQIKHSSLKIDLHQHNKLLRTSNRKINLIL